ncbi:MAG: hypothetical protein JWM44_848 [Bacilli bacterium]|nr:hypothetical protein [Bacilli bacterium]
MDKLLIIFLSVVVILIVGLVLFEGYLFLISQHDHGGPAPES